MGGRMVIPDAVSGTSSGAVCPAISATYISATSFPASDSSSTAIPATGVPLDENPDRAMTEMVHMTGMAPPTRVADHSPLVLQHGVLPEKEGVRPVLSNDVGAVVVYHLGAQPLQYT